MTKIEDIVTELPDVVNQGEVTYKACRQDTPTEYIKDILNYAHELNQTVSKLCTLVYTNPKEYQNSDDKLRDFKNIAIVRKYADEIVCGGKRISEYTLKLERDLIEIEEHEKRKT